MNVKIITDSTSDITSDMAQEMGLTVIPLTVSFGHESFLDRVEITTEEFYRRLSTENIFPTTTQPSPAIFLEAYEKLAQETDNILVIVISGKLSGTYQSALNAKGMLKGKCRVEIIDSQMTIMALGLLAATAAKMAENGATMDELMEAVKTRIPRLHPAMSFDTLKYLAKGGRIGRAQGLLGSVLSIKPILTLKEGEVAPLTRVRSQAAALDYLVNLVAGIKNIEALALEHGNSPQQADALFERISGIYPKEKIYRSTVSPVIGTYTGPNLLSVTVLEGSQ
jgi:DegV family protein with EDD domain